MTGSPTYKQKRIRSIFTDAAAIQDFLRNGFPDLKLHVVEAYPNNVLRVAEDFMAEAISLYGEEWSNTMEGARGQIIDILGSSSCCGTINIDNQNDDVITLIRLRARKTDFRHMLCEFAGIMPDTLLANDAWAYYEAHACERGIAGALLGHLERNDRTQGAGQGEFSMMNFSACMEEAYAAIRLYQRAGSRCLPFLNLNADVNRTAFFANILDNLHEEPVRMSMASVNFVQDAIDHAIRFARRMDEKGRLAGLDAQDVYNYAQETAENTALTTKEEARFNEGLEKFSKLIVLSKLPYHQVPVKLAKMFSIDFEAALNGISITPRIVRTYQADMLNEHETLAMNMRLRIATPNDWKSFHAKNLLVQLMAQQYLLQVGHAPKELKKAVSAHNIEKMIGLLGEEESDFMQEVSMRLPDFDVKSLLRLAQGRDSKRLALTGLRHEIFEDWSKIFNEVPDKLRKLIPPPVGALKSVQ